jgi:hypothetical protein
MRKEIDSELCSEEKRRTGMETSPKEMTAELMAWALIDGPL